MSQKKMTPLPDTAGTGWRMNYPLNFRDDLSIFVRR